MRAQIWLLTRVRLYQAAEHDAARATHGKAVPGRRLVTAHACRSRLPSRVLQQSSHVGRPAAIGISTGVMLLDSGRAVESLARGPYVRSGYFARTVPGW